MRQKKLKPFEEKFLGRRSVPVNWPGGICNARFVFQKPLEAPKKGLQSSCFEEGKNLLGEVVMPALGSAGSQDGVVSPHPPQSWDRAFHPLSWPGKQFLPVPALVSSFLVPPPHSLLGLERLLCIVCYFLEPIHLVNGCLSLWLPVLQQDSQDSSVTNSSVLCVTVP